ncbi:MAG TPA: cytochrome b/b6 domain-containing protein [Symbiobacteriaceae bacterium]|nr:cytochrome b/b6 domain-containing protein [Symbiobacteriaceae bacterium]
MSKAWVKRFEKGVIVIHWLYAASFLTLVITGIGFEYKPLGFLMGPYARLAHRIAAPILVTAPWVYLTICGKSGWVHLKEAFTWRKEDFLWLYRAPLHYMLGKGDMPPAGLFNAGQKLNYINVTITNVAFAVTGVIMWFGRPNMSLEQREIFRWAAIIHQASFWMAVTMFSLHLYLALIHPFTKPAITAMIDGYITRTYAAGHHPRWLAEVELKADQGRVK